MPPTRMRQVGARSSEQANEEEGRREGSWWRRLSRRKACALAGRSCWLATDGCWCCCDALLATCLTLDAVTAVLCLKRAALQPVFFTPSTLVWLGGVCACIVAGAQMVAMMRREWRGRAKAIREQLQQTDEDMV